MIDKSTALCTDQNIKILFLVYNPFLRVGCSQGGWLATQSTPSGSAPEVFMPAVLDRRVYPILRT